MIRFDTKDDAISFAETAQERYKKQLHKLKTMTFDSSAIYPGIPNMTGQYSSKVRFIPKRFKVMIKTGDYVVYLVCDIIFNDFTLKSVVDDGYDLMNVFDLLYHGEPVDVSNYHPPFFSYFRYEPVDIFDSFSKLVGMDGVSVKVEFVIINKK